MLEEWMNEVYIQSKEPTINVFLTWTFDYVKTINTLLIITVCALLIGFIVLYGVLMKNALVGVFLIGVIATFGFFTYYVVVFQPAYPKGEVVAALNSEVASEYLAGKTRHRTEIRGLNVKDIDFATTKRENVNFIGKADTSKLKQITFAIKKDDITTHYTVYGYVEQAPAGTPKNYAEFYGIDEKILDSRVLTDPFFEYEIYNVVVYRK